MPRYKKSECAHAAGTRHYSKIEWTDATWNPVTGCTKVSSGCKFCYAETLAKRLKAMGQYNYRNGFALTLQPHMLKKPLEWKKPRLIFVNSMSDLYHHEVPDDYILRVFDVMRKADWHRFQVLTKRAERLPDIDSLIEEWPRNVWQGVTVENANHVDRIDFLRGTGAFTKFLSCEPLLGSIPNLNLRGIDWVIAGGESGARARLMETDWAREIRDQCQEGGVAFHFKQWGAHGPDGIRRGKKANGRELDGRTWNEWPHEPAMSVADGDSALALTEESVM